MGWVKGPFPPRDRARWLLMTMRLSASSLAGTARTLVAVGTVSETFMFLTTAAAAPRSGDWEPAAIGVAGFGAGAAALLSAGLVSAGLVSAGLLSAGFAAGVGAGAAAFGAGAACWGAACWVAGAALPFPEATGSCRSPPPTGLPGR